MSGYIVYWSKDFISELNRHNDTGPLCVIFGGRHKSMPSISKVRTGDVIFPVTLSGGQLKVMARLPVENIENASEYLIRETGCGISIPIPDRLAEFIQQAERINCKFHQRPQTCADLAASGTKGSLIKERAIPCEIISLLCFGAKGREVPLKLDKNGAPLLISLSGSVRRMSNDTLEVFEKLFES